MANCEWLSWKDRAEKKKKRKKNCICASHTLRRKVAAEFLRHAHLPFDNTPDCWHPLLFIQSSADVCIYLTAMYVSETLEKKKKRKDCFMCDRWIGKSRSHIAQQNSLPFFKQGFFFLAKGFPSSSSMSCSFFIWDSAATSVAWPRISNNLKWSHYCRRGTPSCSRPRTTASANSSRPGTPCWRSWNCWSSSPRNWPPIDCHLKKTE